MLRRGRRQRLGLCLGSPGGRASSLLAQAPRISDLIRQARRPIRLPARGTDRQPMRPPAGVARDGSASRDAPAGLSGFDICEDFC